MGWNQRDGGKGTRFLRVVAILSAGLIAMFAVSGCGKGGGSSASTALASSEAASQDAAASTSTASEVESAGSELSDMKARGGELLDSLLGSNDTYESIYDEYSGKLGDMTPTKIDEFNAEADASDGSIDSLAEICNNKVSDLAETCNEGIELMAKLMYRHGDDYSVYEDWASKLTDVYMSQASEVQDAYMARAS